MAALLDLMVHGLKGMAVYAHQARMLGGVDREIDLFMLDGLFTRVTNVNFDPDDIAGAPSEVLHDEGAGTGAVRTGPPGKKGEPAPEFDAGPEAWKPAGDTAGTGRRRGGNTAS